MIIQLLSRQYTIEKQVHISHNYYENTPSLLPLFYIYNILDILFGKGVVNKYCGEEWFEIFHDVPPLMVETFHRPSWMRKKISQTPYCIFMP